MVRAFLGLVRGVRQAWLLELAGAVLLVAGVFEAWGRPAALAAAGAALVLKAFELDGDG